MTTAELHESFQTAVERLRALRTEAGLLDLDLTESPTLHADARRFAATLAAVADDQAAKALLMADHAGAEAFCFLVRTRWETMETFLFPSAFELLPEPRPFETLCRCEWWLGETGAAEPETEGSAAAELPGSPETDLEWESSTHSGEMPGLVRPVREAFAAPDVQGVTIADLIAEAAEDEAADERLAGIVV